MPGPVTKMTLADVSEIVVGSCVLGFPVALTEAVWDLGESLPWTSMVPVFVSSLFFLGAFVHYFHYRGGAGDRRIEFVTRVLVSYGITFVCCAMILGLADKFALFADPAVAIKRTLLVAFPASFAATVVDALGSRERQDGAD